MKITPRESGTLVSRHSRDAKKVSVAGACHSRDCKNTVFVWELRKTGSSNVKVAVSRAVRLRECPSGELPPYCAVK